ncbi:uncharacterized protein LOC107266817 isoform X2 [Cephus cinctus]|nr:uncharacterized protein LOC107266817 isoform X2 [Cephus cinctus]
MEKKTMFWKLWCDRIRELMIRKENGSSLSETTAASSSSNSTLYLLSSGIELDAAKQSRGDKSVCRVWAHYGGAGDAIVSSWPRKDLYLGPSYNELNNGRYTPVPIRFADASLDDLRYELDDRSPMTISKKACYSWPVDQNFRQARRNQRMGGLCDVLFTREGHATKTHLESVTFQGDCMKNEDPDDYSSKIIKSQSPETKKLEKPLNKWQKRVIRSNEKVVNLAPKLSRFGFGISEKCRSGLYLQPCSGDQPSLKPAYTLLNPYKMIEGGVSLWEGASRQRKVSKRYKHFRRYGLSTAPHFLHALGPWSVQPGERESVQTRRVLSAVNIRRQAADPELRLPVSRRQLAASVSTTALEPGRCGAMGTATRGRVVLFWTPEYWYRPRAATAAYRELRQHLALLREFRSSKEDRGIKRKFFSKRKRTPVQSESRDSTVFEEKSASEILAVKKIDMRARMISRMINAAKKCHDFGNFHSCRSILAGLQSPPIYRLRNTWSYLRVHHAIRYESLEQLCKIYKSPETRTYRRAWSRAECCPPYIPYIGDLLIRLLDTNWKNRLKSNPKSFNRNTSRSSTNQYKAFLNNKNTKCQLDCPNSKIDNEHDVSINKQKSSLVRRILSAAMTRIGYRRMESLGSSSANDSAWTYKQKSLARKVYNHWRSYVLERKILSEVETRHQGMDPRKKIVLDVASWLGDCQRAAQGYDFSGHSLAWEFLLKARYKEDRENFFTSLKLEPYRTT